MLFSRIRCVGGEAERARGRLKLQGYTGKSARYQFRIEISREISIYARAHAMFALFILTFFCWEYRFLSINNFHDEDDTSRARLFRFVHSFFTLRYLFTWRRQTISHLSTCSDKKMKHRYIILFRWIHAGKINITCNILHICVSTNTPKLVALNCKLILYLYFHICKIIFLLEKMAFQQYFETIKIRNKIRDIILFIKFCVM